VGPGKGVKPRLSQALTRDARPDSNSRPAVQISNPLSSRYVSLGRFMVYININIIKFSFIIKWLIISSLTEKILIYNIIKVIIKAETFLLIDLHIYFFLE